MKIFNKIFVLTALAAYMMLPVIVKAEMPKGAHYNLNIIGVENAKKSKMTGSNRHTIFVPLVTKSKGVKSVNNNVEIHTQIWLMPGEDFKVCDGNGFDLAYACDGNELGPWDTCAWIDTDPEPGNEVWEYQCGVISQKEGAVFQLPCNNYLTDDQEDLLPCEAEHPSASYEVWARTLGKPGGSVVIHTCATIQDELQCSTENYAESRMRGRSTWADVTDELTSAVVDYCTVWTENIGGAGDPATYDPKDGDLCTDYDTTRIALFAGDTEDWFWNYVNDGLRLLQLRFYERPAAQ